MKRDKEPMAQVPQKEKHNPFGRAQPLRFCFAYRACLLSGITVCTSEHRVQRLAWMRWSMTCSPVDALVGTEKCLVLIFHFLPFEN